jgi:hypothetical protein
MSRGWSAGARKARASNGLDAGVTVENAQAMAARTTKLYERTADVITLDEVERICNLKSSYLAACPFRYGCVGRVTIPPKLGQAPHGAAAPKLRPLGAAFFLPHTIASM